MKSTEQLKFQIKAIDLLDSSLSSPNEPFSGDEVFNFEVNLEHKISKDDPLLYVICSVRIIDSSKKHQYGMIRTSCLYEIPDLAKHFNEKEQQFCLSDMFITTLNSISISSSRGIMFSAFRGTVLHNVILPIIDPTDFNLSR